ncbi:NADH-cytochrome b5 reductase 1 [Porphyridium purpureum]|uniref:NADH-cytochrome b5 reductase n=1 Tax=Porphyridium purpureum TaxID=35688 RepID=A0A5J4YLB6_PORPP|nr:NADH-cytochrome b5 reductase 1 [Porphyridium purpureum]|eukprot:POR5772..scf291_13
MGEVSIESVMEYVRSNPSVAMGVVVAAVVLVLTPFVLQYLLVGFGKSGSVALAGKNVPRKFMLISKKAVSPNTRIFRFALEHPDQKLGLYLGGHVQIAAQVNGKLIKRQYTPISSEDDHGFFDLLIKIYPTGSLTPYLESLRPNVDEVSFTGPSGKFKYEKGQVTSFGMIAGGTGLTPMWQIFTAILKDPTDTCKVSLIYANVSAEDILLKASLDKLAAEHSDRFSVYYVLNEPPTSWKSGVGFVSEEMIRDHIGLPAPKKKVLMCGPPPMIRAMRAHCGRVGYSDNEIFGF